MLNILKSAVSKRVVVSPLAFKSNKLLISSISSKRFATSWRNKRNEDNKIEFKWFLLVGVFGTMVYITVMQRIQEQDHSKNIERYKKTFTEEEWVQYVNEIQKKHLTLENGEECYLIPYTYSDDNKSYLKSIDSTVENLGGKENVGIVNLNELIANQLENIDGKSKYNILLKQSLESEDLKSPGFKYKFSYKLKPGIFTQIVNDAIIKLKSDNPSLGRFIILNYPPNIKEAVKFEQNVSNKDLLLVLNNKSDDSDIVQYFDTVDKVIHINNMKKLEPFIIDNDSIPNINKIKFEEPVEQIPIANDILSKEPSSDAPAILIAQYKLRQLNQPIREYGETDVDVINRLKKLQG
ncbi:Altered inheritance of mitochondria protein 36, mitochondrial [Pichia californica]|uniref:Altered inheritance of mitochondria protein 36, mitochondrial n=1 Tax=Pichia californica TaxID=460514 RepID=A0A9P7BES5_9ASCO|nr:Altered inheritance of mitochondria protein 36, mitochondrial [[Candida] californica]KAG0688186.1 Altered inheritance of mitochondria protein 36, mitochondrial [[Candida] californica]